MVSLHQNLKLFPNSEGVEEYYLLIFHQNTYTQDWFKTEEFLEVNTLHKYSILKYFNDDFKIDQVFEFIMEYPEYGKFGHWTQMKNPLDADPDEDVHVVDKGSTWGDDQSRPKFIGLHQSSNDKFCFIEGTEGQSLDNYKYWFYAIVQKYEWHENALPGY